LYFIDIILVDNIDVHLSMFIVKQPFLFEILHAVVVLGCHCLNGFKMTVYTLL